MAGSLNLYLDDFVGLSLVDVENKVCRLRGKKFTFNISKDSSNQSSKKLNEIIEKFPDVFAVEAWSSTSNLPPVTIAYRWSK